MESAPSQQPATFRVGTRKSPLAIAQADEVISGLRASYAGAGFERVAMATTGDKDQISALYTMGKGLWTSELEARLTAGELDLVVHSLKDMPTTMPAGCELGAVTVREDPRDVLVVRASLHADPAHARLATLPEGSVIGTSSVRRAAQLRRRYPHLRFKDVRGNIHSRLARLDDDANGYSALVLAAAGLLRMGFGDRITEYLEHDAGGIMHAVGQGALGVEIRAGDEAVRRLVGAVDDERTALACAAERAVMRVLEGGCSVPIGVETRWLEGGGAGGGKKKLRLRATVVSLDGKRAVDGEMVEDGVESKEQADEMGRKMAEKLVGMGAGTILDEINAAKKQRAAAEN